MKTEVKGNDKMKIKPWMWVTASFVVISSIGALIWYRKKKKKEEEEDGEISGSYAAVTSASTSSHRPGNRPKQSTSRGPFRCESRSYPLAYGTCHPDVAILQRHLKNLKADLGTSGTQRNGVDGKFGTMTERAAKAKLGQISFSKADIAGLTNTLNPIKSKA